MELVKIDQKVTFGTEDIVEREEKLPPVDSHKKAPAKTHSRPPQQTSPRAPNISMVNTPIDVPGVTSPPGPLGDLDLG